MSPKYKLTYFDLMAVAEPIRLLFAYAGVEYEDVRVQHADWPNLKPRTPWGVLPLLEEDGKEISQSTTIVRYLGRKFGLTAADEFLTARCNEYIDAMVDLRMEASAVFKEQDETKKVEKKTKLVEESVPRVFKKFDDILTKNGTGFLVGSSVTYADIFIAHFIQFFGLYTEETEKIMKAFPAIAAHQGKIFNLPGIKEWVATRPVTKM